MELYIICGSILGLYFGALILRKSFLNIFSTIRKSLVKESTAFPKMFLELVLYSFLTASPKQQILELYKENRSYILSRKGVMHFCLHLLGYWFILILALLFGHLNPWMVMGGLAPLFVIGNFKFARHLMKLIFGLSIFLLLSEGALRNLSSLQMFFEDSSLIYFLSDNHLSSMILGMCLAAVFTALIGSEYMLTLFTYVGITSGVISINMAWAICFGEIVGVYGFTYFVLLGKRKASFESEMNEHFEIFSGKIRRLYLSSIKWVIPLSLVLSLFIFSFIRNSFVFNPGFGLSGLHRIIELVAYNLISYSVLFILFMTWGHFKSKKLNTTI